MWIIKNIHYFCDCNRTAECTDTSFLTYAQSRTKVLRRVYCTLTAGTGWPVLCGWPTASCQPLCSLKYFVRMNNDKCQLVAWTEGGNVKMSLDLIKEMSQEYLERIKSLESTVYKRHKAGEEVPFILALSFAREEYGNFLNESGLTFLALRQYIEASSVCTSGSDLNWSDCDEGFVLCGQLRARFLEMYTKVRNMVAEDPSLGFAFDHSGLKDEYLDITSCQRSWRKESDENLAALLAWRFGRS